MTNQQVTFLEYTLHLLDEFLKAQFKSACRQQNPGAGPALYALQKHLSSTVDLFMDDPDLKINLERLLAQLNDHGDNNKKIGITWLNEYKEFFNETGNHLITLSKLLPSEVRFQLNPFKSKETFELLDVPVLPIQNDFLSTANILRNIDCKPPFESSIIDFHPAPTSKFFMIATHYPVHIYVGTTALDSLFKIRTFAHEIGHIGDIRPKSIREIVLNLVSATPHETNEAEAYHYELLFTDNIQQFIHLKTLDSETLRNRLIMSRTLKFILDCISFRGTYLLLSDESHKTITADLTALFAPFIDKSINIDPSAYMKFTNISDPLRNNGFIRAFIQHYAPRLDKSFT